MLIYNKCLKQYSRALRKNSTDAERLLWSKVRLKQLKGYQFCRQRVIGDYIVDFLCLKAKLVIELDGSQHYFAENIMADKIRDDYLREYNLNVLRFNDIEVMKNINGVIESILEHLE